MLIGLMQIAVAAGVALFAYRHKSLDFAAMLAAITLAALLYVLGGSPFLAAMLLFFLTSTALSKAGKKRKEPMERELHAHSGARTIRQVAANSLAALLFAVVYASSRSEAAAVGFFSAFAACNADTWASEWGSLSKRGPVSIVTLKPVPRGLSGGVTPLGFVASALGSLAIALFYFLIRLGSLPLGGITAYAAVILVCGFAGSVLDSLMGATFQAKYVSAETGRLTEKPVSAGRNNALAKGFPFINNDLVNLLSSLLAAGLGYILATTM